MNLRERVLKTINHKDPDKVPIDLGGTICTIIFCNSKQRIKRPSKY